VQERATRSVLEDVSGSQVSVTSAKVVLPS